MEGFHSPFGEVDEREPGRRREPLLGAGHDGVDPPFLERERDVGDRADPIDQEERGTPSPNFVRDRSEVVLESHARLIVDDTDGPDVAVLELDPTWAGSSG